MQTDLVNLVPPQPMRLNDAYLLAIILEDKQAVADILALARSRMDLVSYHAKAFNETVKSAVRRVELANLEEPSYFQSNRRAS